MSDAAFTDWGWRIPFLISAILDLLSGYIRLKLAESPLYARLKEEGKASTNPIKDTYTSGRNWGLMAIAHVRRDRTRGGRLVYWSVLCADLSDRGSRGVLPPRPFPDARNSTYQHLG